MPLLLLPPLRPSCRRCRRLAPLVCSQAFVRAATGDPGLHVSPPSPSLVPSGYDGGAGPQLLHWDLRGLQQPGEGERADLTATFPNVVSLVEWAELLRQWGAAPEQRLALYFRRLPQVRACGGARGAGHRCCTGTLWSGGRVEPRHAHRALAPQLSPQLSVTASRAHDMSCRTRTRMLG